MPLHVCDLCDSYSKRRSAVKAVETGGSTLNRRFVLARRGAKKYICACVYL